MEYRSLGRTGMEVSVVGFGCGNVGGLMIRGEHGNQVKAAARAMAESRAQPRKVNPFDMLGRAAADHAATPIASIRSACPSSATVATGGA